MIRVDLLAELLLFGCVIPVNLYPVFYLFRPWRPTEQGRALMVKAWGNALLIDMRIATVTLGDDYPGRDVVRAVGFALFAVGNWLLLIALLRSDDDEMYPPRSWIRRRRVGL